ncbi:MAG: hypothetical protein KatS3mg008_1325 [Acidimicrobiales bacterium]|nr:MAG: hypothetical protein KatS3mg008_1325 [Acidimicrobiales bacterium]
MAVVSPRTDRRQVSPEHVRVPTRVEEPPRRERVAPAAEEPAVGEAVLPVELSEEAEDLEKRGRRWIVISLILCPCHLPVTMAVLAAVFGGTWIGAALQGRALQVGAVLGVLYALALWRAFRAIKRAKRLEAAGGRLRCTPDGCEVTTP